MRRAANAWTRQRLGAGWRSWKASVDLDRVKRAVAARHLAVKTAVRVERRRRKALTGWIAYAASYKRASGLVAKAYAKSRRIYAQSVFDQWCAFCEETETRKETLKRCVTSKRLLTSWFLDWYWRAFEGDIAGALGLITDSTESVMGSVYGENRGVDPSVFRQWQSLGSSLEAIAAGAGPRSPPARAAALKWRGETARRAAETRGGSGRETPVLASPPASRRRLSLSDDGGDSEDEIDRRVLSELGARRR
jgi:protein SFI1